MSPFKLANTTPSLDHSKDPINETPHPPHHPTRLNPRSRLQHVSVIAFDAEGDEEGECSNDADEDEDGLYDCDDPDCAGSDDVIIRRLRLA